VFKKANVKEECYRTVRERRAVMEHTRRDLLGELKGVGAVNQCVEVPSRMAGRAVGRSPWLSGTNNHDVATLPSLFCRRHAAL
jgi:hypothetical protein